MRLLFLLVVLLLVQCADEPSPSESCSTPATVRDVSETGGCGFVLELIDGTLLDPIEVFRCGTPPFPEFEAEDPLSTFEFVDGKKVLIDYVQENAVTICVGQPVRITCIREQPVPTQD